MYRLGYNSSVILRLSDGVQIPLDEANTDYQQYLQWLSEGNSPEPYVEPPKPVPQVVSRFQAKAALVRKSLLDTVEAMMADPRTPLESRLAWQDAQEFRRYSPTVLAMGTALGLSEADLDDLFTVASGIEA